MPPSFNEAIAEITAQRLEMARLWDDIGVVEEKEVGDANLILASIMRSEGTNFDFQAGQKKPYEFIKWIFELADMDEAEIPVASDIDKSTIVARSLMQLTAQKYQEAYLKASMVAQMDFLSKRNAQEQADAEAAKEDKGSNPPLKLVDGEDPK